MSSGEHPSATDTTEIMVVTGDRYRVDGHARDVERIILDAARGSIMEFAWFTESGTGEDVALNPECVVSLRVADA